MSAVTRRIRTALKAARLLGPKQIFWYACYQAGLRSGLWRALTPPGNIAPLALALRSPFEMPSPAALQAVCEGRVSEIVAEADEIAAGQIRLFGGPPVPLNLSPAAPLHHWTQHEGGKAQLAEEDIKFTWEPARFGWVYPLGRAYLLTTNEDYPAAFWQHFETFLRANPLNCGPNWTSGQEVALRLVALLFGAAAFGASAQSTPQRIALLTGAVAAHARRILPTLNYARAQHNNHLITEALGLYLAGVSLPDHPQAARWQQTGWYTLCQAFRDQIAPSGNSAGTYAQHSMNYHRLMLQAALLATLPGKSYPPPVAERLAAATRWLMAQLDPASGQVPNYGSNDGAHILPLACGGFSDYRPTAQSAARAFLGQPALPPGSWDETGLWLQQPFVPAEPLPPLPNSPAIHRLGDSGSWAVLRAVRYTSRPSQADQLHVDLWFQGYNLTLDAGTYRYTAPPPFNNSLACTSFHNTVTIDTLDQMTRAGRFLWLDWAQARILRQEEKLIEAEHDGYRKLGILHRRALQHAASNHWRIADHLLSAASVSPSPHVFHLHWLLPDWPWQPSETGLTLSAPWGGQVVLTVSSSAQSIQQQAISLVRAGQNLLGSAPADPVAGWYSPIYAHKAPALSFTYSVEGNAPVSLTTEIFL